MPTVARFPSRSTLLLLCLLAAPLASPAGAEPQPVAPHRLQGHGMQAPARPLLQRMRLADVVAFGRIERIGIDRIQVIRVETISGSLPERFEIKRSPSSPPGLVTGDVALLLLIGGRSPYLLVDEPRELEVPSEAEIPIWREAVVATAAVGDRPEGLLALYESWLDTGPTSLQADALLGLSDPEAPFRPLDEAFADRRVAMALDPSASADRRAAAAYAACLHRGGIPRLVRVVGEGTVLPPEVVRVVLQTGGQAGDRGMPRALLAALAHDDATLRRVAVGMAAGYGRDDAIAARVGEIAARDPDPDLRRAAQQALARISRGRIPRETDSSGETDAR